MADGGAVESPARPSSSEGLSVAEAERRLAARGGPRRPPPGRSYASIVFANVFNVFNLVLGAFGALTFMFGSWQDALFLCIALANTTIGIAQEAGQSGSSTGSPHSSFRPRWSCATGKAIASRASSSSRATSSCSRQAIS
jgi:hypothetical protein